jgi:hypothetical protein
MAAMMMQAAAASVAASSCSNGETGRLTPLHPSAIAMQRLNCDMGQDGQAEAHAEGSAFSMHGSLQHLHHLSQLHHQHQQEQHHHHQQQQQQAMAQAQAAAAAVAAAVASQHHQQQQQQQANVPASGSDEGFIDEPDCDCDVRNFSTMDTRVPFQYCYHCAPFQSANGRGPTLVPTPSACPSALAASHDDDGLTPLASSSSAARSPSAPSEGGGAYESNFTIYDMDSKSTERKAPCDESRHGTKRRRKACDATVDAKKRRPSEGREYVDVVSTDDHVPACKTSADAKDAADEVQTLLFLALNVLLFHSFHYLNE